MVLLYPFDLRICVYCNKLISQFGIWEISSTFEIVVVFRMSVWCLYELFRNEWIKLCRDWLVWTKMVSCLTSSLHQPIKNMKFDL